MLAHGQATGGKEQEERLRREQEEEQRRQKEGEEQLRQLVRAAVDRTGGKSTPDYRTAAKELCRRHKLPADRANAIIRDVMKDVRRREEEERPPAPAPPISPPLAIAMPELPLAEVHDAGGTHKLGWAIAVPEKQEREQAPARKSRKDMVGQRKPSISRRPDATARDEHAPARSKKKGLPPLVWPLGGGGLLILLCGGLGVGYTINAIHINSMNSIKSINAEDKSINAEDKVSQANFDRIKSGMTEAQVKAIMGEPSLFDMQSDGSGWEVWSGAGSITVFFGSKGAYRSTYETQAGKRIGFDDEPL